LEKTNFKFKLFKNNFVNCSLLFHVRENATISLKQIVQ